MGNYSLITHLRKAAQDMFRGLLLYKNVGPVFTELLVFFKEDQKCISFVLNDQFLNVQPI